MITTNKTKNTTIIRSCLQWVQDAYLVSMMLREITRAFTNYQQVHSCNWYVYICAQPCLGKRNASAENTASKMLREITRAFTNYQQVQSCNWYTHTHVRRKEMHQQRTQH
jgi:hypothetical protein